MFAFSNLTAQEKPDRVKLKEYQLEFVFTGEVSPSLDSTFIAYCVFNERDLKEIKKVMVKTGARASDLKSTTIDMADTTKITRKNKKVYIELGKAGQKMSIIKVFWEKNNGNLEKGKFKKISSLN